MTSHRTATRPALPIRAVATGAVALALALASGCGSGSGGAGTGGGEMRAGDAWAAPSEGVAAVYLRIDNGGPDDRLVGASADVAESVTVMGETGAPGGHTDDDQPIDVAVPRGTTEFSPGSGHVMLTGLAEPLVAGDRLTLELDFDRAGARSVEVEVVPWDEAVERYEQST